MKKRMLSLLLAVVMLCSLVPMMAFAAEEACEICGKADEATSEQVALSNNSYMNSTGAANPDNKSVCSVVDYVLKAGHSLSVGAGYYFEVRVREAEGSEYAYSKVTRGYGQEVFTNDADYDIAVAVRVSVTTSPNANTPMSAGEVAGAVLYDTYSAKHVHKITFDANGGTGSMAEVTADAKEYTLPESTFTAPEGKKFKAWSVADAEKKAGDKITITEVNTTVKAVWEDIPADHKCDIKAVAKVETSCAAAGKEAYYKCEGCGKFFEDAAGTKQIADLSAWGNIAKLDHKDENNDKKCDVCAYDLSNPTTGDNGVMLWVAIMVVSAFGIVATTVMGKKKFF